MQGVIKKNKKQRGREESRAQIQDEFGSIFVRRDGERLSRVCD